jgi:hypothetical protein
MGGKITVLAGTPGRALRNIPWITTICGFIYLSALQTWLRRQPIGNGRCLNERFVCSVHNVSFILRNQPPVLRRFTV